MVKHPIQNHIHAKLMRFADQLLQILLIAKGRVYLIIIINIIFVAGVRAEDRRHV